MKNLLPSLIFLAVASSSWAQLPPPPKPEEPVAEEDIKPTVLSDEEKGAGWKLLFDGRSNFGLRGLTYNDFINRGWKINHGTLFCSKSFKEMGLVTGGHLITAEQYTDFEFSFEWKVAVSGKSGIMYYAAGTREKPVGFVYSIIDDVHHPDGLKGGPIRRTGSLYNVLPPAEDKKLNGPDIWNEGKIVVQGNQVEHWLNGGKVLEYTLGSPAFVQAVRASGVKFPPPVGTKFKTAIVILDEGEEVEFRNLKVRPLPTAAPAPGAPPSAR